ncbi:hypothetical protein CsSME_00052722 [Camellia sinensis var. sinensis]
MFQFRRELYNWERVEATRLVSQLETGPIIRQSSEDTLVWNASITGRFIMESVYEFLAGGSGSLSPISKRIWLKYIPSRVQCFGCLAWKGRLKTADFLIRIGVMNANASSVCNLCKSEGESLNHVSLSCPVTWRAWSAMLR